MTATPAQPLTGLAAIALAVGFNLPYATLTATFEYPDILRRPAGEVLDLFAQGGAGLILTWYAFALAALLFVPLALALALTADRIARNPALAIGAAVVGALSGFVQAIGLLRWVFAVPGLAAVHSDPLSTEIARAGAEEGFALLNAYGGVALGEHLGQLLMAGFVLAFALIQRAEGARGTAWIGFATALGITLGTGEGLALALGRSGEVFSIATITGFLGLTLWLILTGVQALRRA